MADELNPAYLSALSALCGSAIGATASFATTWVTQRTQERIARRQREFERRERLFGSFIDEASKLYADALVNSFKDPSRLVVLYGILNKLRLFASAETTAAAQSVLDEIVATYRQPPLREEDFEKVQEQRVDLLQSFTRTCRRELS